MENKKIVFASDYKGIELRNSLSRYVQSLGIEVKDAGIEVGSSLDYVDVTKLLMNELHNNTNALGVIVCDSGQGVAISANRSSQIRAAMCRTSDDVISVRSKLNANVLCLGSEYSTFEEAKGCLDAFIKTPFKDEKHGKCVAKLNTNATAHRYDGVNIIVRAIITYKNHILLTTVTESNKEFASDLYFLPGGHVEYKESAIAALKRELKEEMNVDGSSLNFAGALECTWDRKGRIYHELNLVYKVEIPALDLDNPPKAVDHAFHQFVWRPISEIENYKILPQKLIPLILQATKSQGPNSLFFSQMLGEEAA
ncbi:RpiB/LacA/LacB family sugar-phosphate isomerase [Candidatus Odyssella acanthamoebae]|uniref:RpiB/LacA/LacB family sugar-phosphate isomerase n=1 Tax=Candidatus Odyssella acanthamoebae TaxID=91604 RepID=UPI000691DF52|nr:RpiB/LacA/LacB family sugar-phosphate isomerase [Candidatus Paracaedibacter acanthamoebae]